jgi:hypothetical protein
MGGVNCVGQAFQPAGLRGFPAPCFNPLPDTIHNMQTGDWKVARTGRLESLPYIQSENFTDSTSEFGFNKTILLGDSKKSLADSK